jgi:hypothetical protein
MRLSNQISTRVASLGISTSYKARRGVAPETNEAAESATRPVWR